MSALLLWSLATASAEPRLDQALEADCATVAIATLRDAALSEAAAGDPGLSLALVDAGIGLSTEPRPAPGAPPPAPELAVRNPYGDIPHSQESEHFVVWWGDEGPELSEEQIDDLLAALEEVWSAEIDVMGYPVPVTADEYKINFYLGNTDSRLPDISGGAYYTTDIEGYPMLVSHTDQVEADLKGVAAHEFFHALQAACSTYEYAGQGAWYWEAGANWMPIEVFPELRVSHDSIWAVVMRPELPISFFKYPEEWTPEDIHQYGAWIFVQFADEFVGGPELIRDSWTLAPSGGDPLEVLGDLSGIPMEQLYFDFVVANATWDYEHGDEIAADAAGGQTEADSHWSSGPLPAIGEDPVSPAFPPYDFGSNYWEALDLPASFTLRFTPEDTDPDWFVALVTRIGEERQVQPMDMETSLLHVAEMPAADEAWLVVAAVVDTRRDEDTYSYALTTEAFSGPEEGGGEDGGDEDTADDDDEGSSTGCGCGAAAPAGGLALLPVFIGLWRRRRR